MMTATALVQTGPRQSEFQEFELPQLKEGEAIVRVEANGVCASDIEAYEDTLLSYTLPRINGHEIVGVLEQLGPGGRRDGLKVGDRVAINPLLGCGTCPACRRDEAAFCSGWAFSPATYGFISTSNAPSLWGGYSTHAFVTPNTVLYPFPEETDPLDATLWNPLAGGIQWAVLTPGTTLGTSVAVLGCGQRGLSSILAARSAGAGTIMTTGLTRDQHKLDLALEFGADAAVNIEQEDAVERAYKLTQGRGFDTVVDTTPGATKPLVDAIEMLRPGGTLVAIGVKSRNVPDFPIDKVVSKGIRIIGSIGAKHQAFSMAANLIAEGKVPVEKLRTHVFGFDQLPLALDTLKGSVPDEDAINVVVKPEFMSN